MMQFLDGKQCLQLVNILKYDNFSIERITTDHDFFISNKAHQSLFVMYDCCGQYLLMMRISRHNPDIVLWKLVDAVFKIY